jgi:sodium/potassium-transporting ATPase subunit alpha
VQIHRLPLADVFTALRTSPHGLSGEEAQRRLQEFGANEISSSRKTSFTRKLVQQFTHFLAILLWIAAGLAYLASSLQPGEGMDTLAYAIIAVIVINALFSFFQEYRAEQASMALRGLLLDRVSVLRSSAREEVHARARSFQGTCCC